MKIQYSYGPMGYFLRYVGGIGMGLLTTLFFGIVILVTFYEAKSVNVFEKGFLIFVSLFMIFFVQEGRGSVLSTHHHLQKVMNLVLRDKGGWRRYRKLVSSWRN